MGMQYSNTTTKDGLLQDCEFWTGLGDGNISGDSTLKARFTGLLNRAYDEVLPIVFSSDAKWQWDDSNHTKNPIATTDLVSGQAEYSFTSDEQGNSILEIEAVYVKGPDGQWKRLAAIDTESDAGTDAVFAQNSNNTGTPTRYEKRANSIWLDKVPDYSQAGGIRVLFARTPDYFTTSDTTQTPGIPAPFHRLLSLIASYDWVCVNKAENVTLISRLEVKIAETQRQLGAHMSKRSRDERPVIRTRSESSR